MATNPIGDSSHNQSYTYNDQFHDQPTDDLPTAKKALEIQKIILIKQIAYFQINIPLVPNQATLDSPLLQPFYNDNRNNPIVTKSFSCSYEWFVVFNTYY